MSDKVRLGIVGIGNMGSEHCRLIMSGKVPGIEIVAVADRRESRRNWAREKLPDTVQIFTEGETLITSGVCEAVMIVTPHYQHPHLAKLAFENGLHVLSEKPIGVYMQDVRLEIEAADKCGKTFALMFNQRTNCVYRKLREMIHSGELGAVKRVNWTITDWYRTQCYYDSGAWRATWDGEGGGVLINQCPHQLDLLQWIFGMPEKVRAFCHVGKWHHVEVEDDVTAYMEFPGGATGVFITSTGDLPGVNRLEVMLEKGRIECDGKSLKMWRIPENERDICFSAKEAFYPVDPEEICIETDGLNEQHVGVLKAFAAHILRGEPLVADGREGIYSLMLSNAMYLSSWTERPVTMPMDEDLFLELLNARREQSVHKKEVDITFITDHSSGGQIVKEQ